MSDRLGASLKRNISLGLVLFAVVGMLPVVLGNHQPPKPVHTPAKSTTAVTGIHDVLGASIVAADYRLEVSKWTIADADAVKQTRRVTVSVAITNTSSQELQISPGLQMTLNDDRGTSYPMTARYLPPDQVIGGPLDPKQSHTFDVDFELPAQANPTLFSFQTDASSPVAKVKL